MRPLAIALLLVLQLFPCHALAGDRQAARAAYEEGNKYYYLTDFDKALEAYRRAYFSYEDEALLFNIAQCYRALGKKDEAAKFYRSYLRKATDPPNRAEVLKIITALEVEIAGEKATAQSPPNGTIPPMPSLAPPEPPHVVVSPSVRPAPAIRSATPLHKRWWIWTVAGIAVVGSAVAIGVGVAYGGKTQATLDPWVVQ